MTGDALLTARQACRRFGYRMVLRDVGLAVGAGELVTLVGPNGAGKTTLLRILAGLLRPTSGSVTRRGRLGMVAHQTMLYESLTAQENLRFYAKLFGLEDHAAVDATLDRMGLAAWRHERAGTFSHGMQRRLSIARALLNDPDLFLFDEPLSGLDESGVQTVTDLLRELRERGRAIVVVTHQYERLLGVSSAVGFLVGSRLHGPEPLDGLSAADVTERYRGLMRDG